MQNDTSAASLTLASLCQSLPLLGRIMAKHGQFTGCLWVRTLKTRKGISALVTKETRATVRIGLEHDNRTKVIDARANGDAPAVNAGLPWGEWLAYPYVIGHKGKVYVRLYPVEGRFPKVIYRLNGATATKAEVEPLCLASEFGEVRADIGCFTLGLANLVRVR